MKFENIIMTIFDYRNYGNRLQNYAMNAILEKYGNCTTINMSLHNTHFWDSHVEVVKERIKHMYSVLFRNDHALEFRRAEKGKLMTKRQIPSNSFFATEYAGFTGRRGCSYNRVVIGSDQVWNYLWLSETELKLRLGSFVSNNHPIISYAASFGVSEVEDRKARAIFQQYLPRLKAISVREDRGAELVREMTGLDATVVLDPTLMLTADKWLEITKGFVSDGDRYVLTYFLGRPSDEQERDIQAYAKAHGCRVRRILDLRDRDTYVAGPQDFVELFSKARYVFTDSYHACCFSILFHKQFTVFNRAGMTGKSNMNSRMETLFRLFDLDSVMMDSGLAPEIDYRKVDRLLEQHRRESQDWLDRVMEE